LPLETIWLFSDGTIGQPSHGAPSPVEPKMIIFPQVVQLAVDGLRAMKSRLEQAGGTAQR
jgi:hypothetical protein